MIAATTLDTLYHNKLNVLCQRKEVELPRVQKLVQQLRGVLDNTGKLDESLIKTVFQKKQLLLNARKKINQTQRSGGQVTHTNPSPNSSAPHVMRAVVGTKTIAQGVLNPNVERSTPKGGFDGMEVDKEEEEGEEASSFEENEDVVKQAEQHSMYLRSLRGKTGRQLTDSERNQVERVIEEKEAWCRGVEGDREINEFLLSTADIVEEFFKIQGTLTEVERDKERHEKGSTNTNQESHVTNSHNLKEQHPVPNKVMQKRKAACTEGDGTSPKPKFKKQKTGEGLGFGLGKPAPLPHDILDWMPKDENQSRLNELCKDYLRRVENRVFDEDLVSDRGEEVCGKCLSPQPQILNGNQGTATCPNCQECIPYQEYGRSSLPFKNSMEIKKNPSNITIKLNHCKEWLNRVQAKRRTHVPEHVLSAFYAECRRLNWTSVTKVKTRTILKRLGFTNQYDNDVTIARIFNDIPTPEFTEEEIRIFVGMFLEALSLFDQCPWSIKQRKNFLSYSYFFHQCCRMNGWKSYLQFFPLLFGEKNRARQDRIFQWMCNHKQTPPPWTFYPTV